MTDRDSPADSADDGTSDGIDRSAAARGRLFATLRVQYPDALAPVGYRLLAPDTGEPYTDDRRHLVTTCRSVANFALGAAADGPDWCDAAAEHGLRLLREGHRAGGDGGGDGGGGDPDDSDAANDGYRLVVRVDPDAPDDPGAVSVVDGTRSAYAHAFVVLAFARAAAAGVVDAAGDLSAAVDLLVDRFVEPNGRLRSDHDREWRELEPYRGQNANMHACEAFLAAHAATGNDRYLDRASTIARGLCVELAAETDGLVWEHYDAEWRHHFSYNADAPRHQFRPPGYQPGHHVEWAKLCALLDRRDADDAPDEGWYRRGVDLFDDAVDLGWTGDGFVYTVDRDGDVLVPDRYAWAVAEGAGAAASLAERAATRGETDEADRFREWTDRLTDTLDRFRGPAGTYYEKREADGRPIPPEPPGVEPDYHPAGAAAEAWRSFGGSPSGDE